MSEARSKARKNNKVAIIAICVVAVIILTLVLFLVFIDRIVASVKMADLKNNISECEQVVVSSPMYFDGLNSGAEEIITGERAEELTAEFLSIAESLTFDKVVDGSSGIWDIVLTFYTDDSKYIAYIEEDAITVTDGSGYRFKADGEAKDTYAKFYTQITDIIAGT